MVIVFLFVQSKKDIRKFAEERDHKIERRKVRRSAHEISKTIKEKPKFWMGKRVN